MNPNYFDAHNEIQKMQAVLFKHGIIYNLAGLGIDPKFFKFNVIQMESEKYISVIDVDQFGVPQLTIIELFNKMNLVKRPAVRIEGSLMHLKENIIALKASSQEKGHFLQIFNMDKKYKLKHIQFSESIVYWKWLTETILGVITTTSVYHVNIANQFDKEVKIFQIFNTLKQGQVTGYVLSSDQKWSALYGISTPDGGHTINGHIQLYFIQNQKQQLIEGHACNFGKIFIHNDSHASNIFCHVEKNAGQQKSILRITQISPPPQGYQKHKKNNQIVYDQSTPNDFAISLIVSEKYNMLYIITKFGFVYIYELISCEQIYKTRISNEPIFLTAKNITNDGILTINKNGLLIAGIIDDNNLLPHILNNLGAVYDNLGRSQQAIKCYQTAIQINPDDPSTHYNLGNVYAKMDKFNDALQSYKNALAKAPNNNKYKNRVDMIKQKIWQELI